MIGIARIRTATIRRRIASLASLFQLNGLADPANSPEVILALKRMHRQKSRFQQQAFLLTRDILDQLLAVCGEDIMGQRDRVMLLLGYETMRRRSELCAFTFEDIETLPKGKHALRMRFSKTDQFGKGKLLAVSETLLAAIDNWGKLTGGTGRILRGLYSNLSLRDFMSPVTINHRLKWLQKKAGLSIDGELSGHSFRVGAAVDLLEAGESLEKIMLRGGWGAETTAIKYLRAWQGL